VASKPPGKRTNPASAQPSRPASPRAEQNGVTFPAGTTIPNSPLALLRPVRARVVESKDGVSVESSYLGEWGYGPSLDEAKADFLSSLLSGRDSLARVGGILGAREQLKLRRLRALIGASAGRPRRTAR
jgi:hypothetical protein